MVGSGVLAEHEKLLLHRLELLQVSALDHVLVVAAMTGVAAFVLHHLESPRGID